MNARFLENQSVEGQPAQEPPVAAPPRQFRMAVPPTRSTRSASSRRTDEGVLTTLRQGRVRENLCLLSLGSLLGAQCLLPALAVAGDAKAAQRQAEARQLQQKQEERAGDRRAAQEAEKRSKAQPVPAWYKRLHEGEKARLQQMRAAKVPPVAAVAPVRLAQLPPAEQAPALEPMPSGGSFRDGTTTVGAFQPLPKLPARATVTTQALAQMVSRSRMPWNRPRAAKPGVIAPSAPLYVPNPLTTTKKLDLSGKRVPEQLEISREGQMCGALAPAAPADTQVLAKQLNDELQRVGVAEGITAQASMVTPAGRLVDTAQKRLKRAQGANRDFAQAMNLWNGRQWKASVKMLGEYAKEYPQSPWTPEALIHIADDAKFQGKPNDASDLYEEVMGMTSAKPGPMSYEAHQKAYERLSDLYLIQGRYSEAWPILSDILQHDLHWRRRTWASHWIGQLEIMRSSRATMVAQRDCGNKALAMVLSSLGQKGEAKQVAALTPPREAGFNMAELQQVGEQQGLALRGFQARAEQLAQLPLPAVLHYSFSKAEVGAAMAVPVSDAKGQAGDKYLPGSQKPMGHFVVAWKVDQAHKLVHLENPQDGLKYVLSYQDLDREWSGRGLLLASRLEKGRKIERVAWLSQGEMKSTTGACFVVSKQVCLGCLLADFITQSCCGGTHGSPAIGVNRISQNIFISDTPVWYTPPVGPPVEVTISYNSQDASNYNTCFGNKWSFNYGSHVVETSDGRATLFMPDGRQDTYLPNGSGGFTSEKGNFDTLVKTAPFSYELRFQQGGKMVYGIPAGTGGQQPFLLSQVDRWNNALTFGYNSSVQMTTITDAQGKVTQLQWASGPYGSRISRVIDPFERHADFSYDDNGNMVQCVDMEGNAFQYTYDASVNVVMLNTAQGPWSFEFHDYGPSGSPTFGKRSTVIWNPLQEQPQRYDYDGGDHIGQYWTTDHRQAVTRYTATQVRSATYYNGYSSVGADSRISSLTTPTGESANYSYDPNTLGESSMSGSNGLYTNTSYNAQGEPTQIHTGKSSYYAGGDPNERVTTYTYAPNGLDVISVTNTLNQTVHSATYNSQHQPLSVTDQGNHNTTYTYTPSGAPATVTDASNVTISCFYTPDQRLQRVERAGAVLASYTYDTIGRVKTSTDAGGFAVGYSYNNLDKLTKTTYPDGTYSQTQYVCCGLPGAERDRSGRWTFYDYDPLKRIARTQDAAVQSIFYGYDAESNLVSLRDARSRLTTWRYDASNREVRKVYADGKWDGLTYEPGTGRLKEKRDGSGRVTSYSYDDYGRLSGVTYPTMPSVSFSYDALDRPTAMQDGLGTSTWSYDPAGHLQSASGPFGNDTLSYHYDALDRRDGMSIADAQGTFNVGYGYDAFSRLQNVSSLVGNFVYSYVGATSRPQSLSLPNGASTTYGYDSLQRLTEVQSARNGSNLSHYAYSYDNTTYRPGRTAEVSQVLAEPSASRSYSYDDVDQLTGEAVSVGGAAQSSASLVYDPMGNRSSATSTSAVGTSTANYGNNKLNQLVSLSNSDGTTTSLSYDPNGNLSSVSSGTNGTLYGYDEADRLLRVEVPGQSKSTFAYDGLGRLRVSQDYSWQNNAWVRTSEVHRIYDGRNVVQERDANNVVLATYTRSGNIGGVLSRTDANGSLFYHYDGRGNVTQLSDAQGQIQARYSYDAWGNTSASGPAASLNRFRFSAKEQFGNLYSYGYRFYSPNLGRWINRDPIAEQGGMNLYGFVANNPTNEVDAYGLILFEARGGRDRGQVGGSSGLGSDLPYKHCRDVPGKPGWIKCKDANGHWPEKRAPDDWAAIKKRLGRKDYQCQLWWRRAWDWGRDTLGDLGDDFNRGLDGIGRAFPTPDPDDSPSYGFPSYFPPLGRSPMWPPMIE